VICAEEFGKKPGSNVTIYRRNLQRAYIERMSYLMKEEIKSGRPSDYYNVAQSDVEDWFEEN
jgi:hypothetical protein